MLSYFLLRHAEEDSNCVGGATMENILEIYVTGYIYVSAYQLKLSHICCGEVL